MQDFRACFSLCLTSPTQMLSQIHCFVRKLDSVVNVIFPQERVSRMMNWMMLRRSTLILPWTMDLYIFLLITLLDAASSSRSVTGCIEGSVALLVEGMFNIMVYLPYINSYVAYQMIWRYVPQIIGLSVLWCSLCFQKIPF